VFELNINLKNRIKNKQSVNRNRLYEYLIDKVFQPMRVGRLTMLLPDGSQKIYGDGEGVQAFIKIHDWVFFKKCVWYGDVGFGESFVDGDWETEDIAKVIEWMIANVESHPTLMADEQKRKPVNFLKMANNLLAFCRRNSTYGSRKNISDHYDLGNDFFKLFLDPTMTYSSAYYRDIYQTLEEAQLQKYEELCRKLKLKQSDHVLEIGSGWGGFAMYAAKQYGCHVTTVTISQEQFDYARNKITENNLTDLIDIQLKDYRKLEGVYDKLVSIEMIEAVGHEYLETFFSQCHNLLKKDGILALQMILSPDHRYDSFRKNIDWIQKHIFPGSLLPSVAAIQQSINKTGTMCLYDFEDITAHYVKTLIAWKNTFNQKTDAIYKLGFNDRFIRKWNYYWSYCEAAFKTRNISIAQAVYSRPNNPHLD
jgi:cyclopropane-fatty-acyl-phospholipid synthase